MGLDELARKLFPPMVDPSALLSRRHVESIGRFQGKVFLPRTIYEVIFEEEDFGRLARTARNFSRGRPSALPTMKQLFRLRSRLLPYRTSPRFSDEIAESLQLLRLPDDAKSILS